MSWAYRQLGLFALAAFAALASPAEVTPAAPEVPACAARGEQLACPSAPAEGERPGVRKAGAQLADAICTDRSGPPRVDLRSLGAKAWSHATSNSAANVLLRGVARHGPAPARRERVRLHVLLCTWLN
jgi:hypothetical protein